jgi:hypothetical protein
VSPRPVERKLPPRPHEQRWVEPFLAEIKLTATLQHPQLYEAKAQNGEIFHSIAARTACDADAMGDAVREAISTVDRDQPVWKIRSMASLLDRGVGERSPAAPGFASTMGTMHLAELRWYEATGIGRRNMKIKRYLEQ